MVKAVISGDIVASTSLSDAGRTYVEETLQDLFERLKTDFDVFGRIIKGDYIECVVPQPENSLRIALVIKSLIKSISINDDYTNKSDKRVKLFKTYGIRLAIGYGELSRYNSEKGIIDGEAIYLSGRKLSELSTYNKERVTIKNSLYFVSSNEKLNTKFDPLLALLDVLINKATSRQSEVLYYKLMKFTEEDIVSKMKISQPVVNQHSTSVGWSAIESAINYYSNTLKNL